MKALTICQPYAELIARGEKRVENRTWETKYRGQLAIHAGKSREWLKGYRDPPAPLDFGAVVCLVELVECVKAANHAELETWLRGDAQREQRYAWLRCRPYVMGPYLWVLADVERLDEPIPARGKQGLWEWSHETFGKAAASGWTGEFVR